MILSKFQPDSQVLIFRYLVLGFAHSWPERRSRDVTFARLWPLESPRSSWERTRPSHTTMSSTWNPNRTTSMPTVQRSWSRAALRATTPPYLPMDRWVSRNAEVGYKPNGSFCASSQTDFIVTKTPLTRQQILSFCFQNPLQRSYTPLFWDSLQANEVL